jgi:hypothetical protein
MVKQTVVSVNGKKTAYLNEKITKVDKSKYVEYKNPPILNSSVVSVNSNSVCRDSKRNRRKQIMANLNTAAQVINSLVEATKLPQNYVENGASLWVFSIRDLVAKQRKQGSGVTLVAKGGYITTRQNKEDVVSLPFFQSMEISTFGCKLKDNKLSATYSNLVWKDNGHEYPYNTKLQFSVKLCQEICIAALGESGLGSLFTHQLEDTPNAKPIDLLKEITKPSIWWNKIQKVLLCCDLQIQLLVVVDANKIQNRTVSKIYGTDNYAFDFDVTDHVIGFQVVSSYHKEYIWGLNLPKQVIQVVEATEKEEVTFYKSVDEIPLNSKNAENQLRKLFIAYMNEHEEYHTNLEAGRTAFLAEGVISTSKLGKWLVVDTNTEKAKVWLSKIKFTPHSKTSNEELESKSSKKEERQLNRAGSALGGVISPADNKEEPKSEEKPKSSLSSTFSMDEEDESWDITAE